jgi:hypothetical protein
MRVKSIIVEDFYKNPGDVRNFALSQEYSKNLDLGRAESSPFLANSIKESIAGIMMSTAGEITGWEPGSGRFTLSVSADPVVVSNTEYPDWTAIIFLTPNAPLEGGISILRHKETGLNKWEDSQFPPDISETSPVNLDKSDLTKWHTVDSFSNLYNRMVIYQSDTFNRITNNFGQSMEDGRLCQVFGFNTEK